MLRLLLFPFREDGVFNDVALDPLKVDFLGAIGVRVSPNGIANYF